MTDNDELRPDDVTPEQTGAPRSRRWLWIGLATLGAIALIAVGGFLIWALTPLGPEADALAALETNSSVMVEQTSYGWDFAPAGVEPTSAVVIYPGGRVDARSYATLAQALAEKGHLASIVKVPLSLAILDAGAAADVVAAHPEVELWIVSGHSLGGVAASQYAFDNAREVDGLALYASYPLDDTNMTALPLKATSILGTEDTVINQENYAKSPQLLPADTEYANIRGGNHAQFGDYGPQPGDTPADITPQQQIEATVVAVDRLASRIAGGGPQ